MRRAINFVCWILSLLASVGMLYMVLELVNQHEKIGRGIESRVQTLLLADELRQSSDDLTRFARTYAATSDPRYRERFQTVLDIRDGKAPRPQGYDFVYWDLEIIGALRDAKIGDAKPILERFRDAGLGASATYALNTAKSQSDTLAEIEGDAFRLVHEGRADEALKILFSEDYHRAKGGIMGPIKRFQESANKQAADALASKLKEINQRTKVIIGLALASLLLSLLAGTLRIRSMQ